MRLCWARFNFKEIKEIQYLMRLCDMKLDFLKFHNTIAALSCNGQLVRVSAITFNTVAAMSADSRPHYNENIP